MTRQLCVTTVGSHTCRGPGMPGLASPPSPGARHPAGGGGSIHRTCQSSELRAHSHEEPAAQRIIELRKGRIGIGIETGIVPVDQRLLVEQVVYAEPDAVLVPAVSTAEVEQVVVRRIQDRRCRREGCGGVSDARIMLPPQVYVETVPRVAGIGIGPEPEQATLVGSTPGIDQLGGWRRLVLELVQVAEVRVQAERARTNRRGPRDAYVDTLGRQRAEVRIHRIDRGTVTRLGMSCNELAPLVG